MTANVHVNKRLVKRLREVIRLNEAGKGPQLYAACGQGNFVRVHQVRISMEGLCIEARALSTGAWFFITGFETRP